MSQVPVNGFLDAISKFRLRQPAQFLMNLCGVDGVSAVVAFSVLHIGNQTFRLAQLFEDELYNINVRHFVMAADVVDFTYGAFMNNQVDSLAVVFHIEPVPHVFAISIYGKRFISQYIGNH